MTTFIDTLIKWSEVWALLIPLTIIVLFRKFSLAIKPIKDYVIFAFILNIITVFISEYHKFLPASLSNNNILYNLHSIVRVIFFSWFLTRSDLIKPIWLAKLLIPLYICFVLINFLFFANPFFLSPYHISAESILLLLFYLSFILNSILEEHTSLELKHPAFLICAGICLYEAINFFIFLFFYPVMEVRPEFGIITMKIFSLSYILLCILMAIAIYLSRSIKSEIKNG